MSNSLQPHGLYSPWNSPCQNIGVGTLSLLQGIFLTQGSNPGLLHCRQILQLLSLVKTYPSCSSFSTFSSWRMICSYSNFVLRHHFFCGFSKPTLPRIKLCQRRYFSLIQTAFYVLWFPACQVLPWFSDQPAFPIFQSVLLSFLLCILKPIKIQCFLPLSQVLIFYQ